MYVLAKKSQEFALEVINVCKILRANQCENALINNFLRAGTSIGEKITLACHCQDDIEFNAKMHSATKSVLETEYWFNLIVASGFLSDEISLPLMNTFREIKRILLARRKTHHS